MALFDPIAALALCSAMLLLGLLLRQRRPSAAREPSSRREALDTVQDWPPQATRVLTVAERRAHELLRTALPGMLVLAQVPLSRFLHVPTRHSYVDWMQRVGGLSADLLVCNADSRVLAVIDIRGPAQTERSSRRHERMARVLKAAGIEVLVWGEEQLPTASQLRAVLGGVLARSAGSGVEDAPAKPRASQPMPLIPVAEIEELLQHGDAAAQDARYEPVPSGFYDELDAAARAGG